jgi:hypothetical protein
MMHQISFNEKRNKENTHFFFHSRVDHDITTLDAFRSALQAFVNTLRDDHFDFLFLLRCQTSAHKLFHLLCLLALSKLCRLCDAFGFLQSLLQTLCSPQFLSCFCFCNLFDRSDIKSALLGAQSLYGFFRNGYVGNDMFGLIIKKPRREAFF